MENVGIPQGPNRSTTVLRAEHRLVCGEVKDAPEDRLHRAFTAGEESLGFTLNFPSKCKGKAGMEVI